MQADFAPLILASSSGRTLGELWMPEEVRSTLSEGGIPSLYQPPNPDRSRSYVMGFEPVYHFLVHGLPCICVAQLTASGSW